MRAVRPGPETADDLELTNYVRRKGETAWHPVGTCRMGSRSDAVVDPHLRVHGIEGLRIADMSVTPFHVSSNTHVPVLLMGEKAVDLILTGRWLAKKRLTNISERSSNCTRTLTAPAVTST
ncbi:MAG: GMC oxidoreductase [Alphaproteobacteria bacterium]|nr:GMC oxidoreductase [Alphaproteobacteria bacterium]